MEADTGLECPARVQVDHLSEAGYAAGGWIGRVHELVKLIAVSMHRLRRKG